MFLRHRCHLHQIWVSARSLQRSGGLNASPMTASPPPILCESRVVAEERQPERLHSHESSTSSEDERPYYRPLDERHIPEIDVEAELRPIVEEEAILYEAAKRNMVQLPDDEGNGEARQALFRVLTTRYGQAYHHRQDC